MSNRFIRVKFTPQKDNQVDVSRVCAPLKQTSRLTLETSALFVCFVLFCFFFCGGYLTLTREL